MLIRVVRQKRGNIFLVWETNFWLVNLQVYSHTPSLAEMLRMLKGGHIILEGEGDTNYPCLTEIAGIARLKTREPQPNFEKKTCSGSRPVRLALREKSL